MVVNGKVSADGQGEKGCGVGSAGDLRILTV